MQEMTSNGAAIFGLGAADIAGAIFDLDGVLVDTAKYHYLAWKRLARELGFDFTEHDNERLKGVSRVRSLEILLETGGLTLDEEQKEAAAARKNTWYVEYLYGLDETALLPGAKRFLFCLRRAHIGIALGSASKNAPLILERLNIAGLFDAVIDGNAVSRAKPDPEVFLKGAEALRLPPARCVVFEDSLAGVAAAKKGGMWAIGVGKPENLPGADSCISSLAEMLSRSLPTGLPAYRRASGQSPAESSGPPVPRAAALRRWRQSSPPDRG
jgi:beta-phosphoglucomutase